MRLINQVIHIIHNYPQYFVINLVYLEQNKCFVNICKKSENLLMTLDIFA